MTLLELVGAQYLYSLSYIYLMLVMQKFSKRDTQNEGQKFESNDILLSRMCRY